MTEAKGQRSRLGRVARLGGVGIALVIMAAAFVGMGLFMWNMGRNMCQMTQSVVPMSRLGGWAMTSPVSVSAWRP